MAPTSKAVCFLTEIGGAFAGGGEWVQIATEVVEGTEFWTLTVQSQQANGTFASARCYALDQSKSLIPMRGAGRQLAQPPTTSGRRVLRVERRPSCKQRARARVGQDHPRKKNRQPGKVPSACRLPASPIVVFTETMEEGVLRCGACGQEYGGDAWRGLPRICTLGFADVRRFVVDWPEGRIVEVRACRTCGQSMARTARGSCAA
jgi:hypothetical protein